MKSGIKLLFVCLAMMALAITISCSKDDGPGILIPAITGFSPESGKPGESVTITGSNLSGATSVAFGTAEATIVSNTDSEIVITIPDNAVASVISVTTEGGVATTQGIFDVIIIGAVAVSEVSAKSAQVGETVTLTGTDMISVTSVVIGGVDATVTSTTETTAEVVIGTGTPLGPQTFTITNEGGTSATTFENLEFYVIKLIDSRFIERFEDADEAVVGGDFVDFVGSQDAEEQTVHGRSNDPVVLNDAQMLPTALDGVFWHMEGYSSTELAGGYIGQLALATQDIGTFADFFAGVELKDIYYNISVHIGDLPAGYGVADNEYVFGLRYRFDAALPTDIYAFRPSVSKLTSMGFEADANGWWDLSIPATEFDDANPLGTYDFANLRKYSIAARRDYGLGTILPLEQNGGEFYTLSFDNISLSIGGPHSFLD